MTSQNKANEVLEMPPFQEIQNAILIQNIFYCLRVKEEKMVLDEVKEEPKYLLPHKPQIHHSMEEELEMVKKNE